MQDHSLGVAKQVDPRQVPKEVLAIVDTLSQEQMMNLRHHLDMELQIEINQLNLTEELGLQYRQGKILLNKTQEDSSVPANQKAQVFNSVQAQLDKIVKLRSQVFSQERLKRFEGALLKVLEQIGTDRQKEVFLDLYGSFMRDKGQ